MPALCPPKVDCFSVSAAAEPSTLPRLLNVFALFGVTPNRFHSALHADQIVVDIQVEGLAPGQAELVAKKLGGVVTVSQILRSAKRLAA